MWFESVRVSNLRCLARLDYEPDPNWNLICGPNGSGKTSVLECFSLASMGKSFLTNRAGDIVRRASDGLAVKAKVNRFEQSQLSVSVEKKKGCTKIALNGQAVLSASELARHVPILVINSGSPNLLTASPSNRRALIDRTLFHVEPSFAANWHGYRQALLQRNSILRRSGTEDEARYWNKQLAGFGESINSERVRVVAAINSALSDHPVRGLGSLVFGYKPGWNPALPLVDELEKSWKQDLLAGYTRVGVQRADMSLSNGDGKSVAKMLSRGQGKAIICAAITGLANVLAQRTRTAPVMLVDDLAAELDDHLRESIVDMINDVGGQKIYTAIKPAHLPEIADLAGSVFHVEQHLQPSAP